jgi:hypothetical protein
MTFELRRLRPPDGHQQYLCEQGLRQRCEHVSSPDNHHGWAELLDFVIVSFMGP